MSRIRPTLRLAAAATLLVAPFLGACQTHPRLEGQRTQIVTQGPLSAKNPADIAIAPVVTIAPDLQVPDQHLREAAARALIPKLYSPLALERVDESIVGPVVEAGDGTGTTPATYRRGSLREDAVLELVVHGWDQSLWQIRRTLVVDIEARVLDPNEIGGSELWSLRLPGERFDLTDEVGRATSDERAMEMACQVIMREVLAKLPARDPEVGPRSPLN